MNGRRARGRGAFTLIELMIVVAIIGILAAIAIPKFAGLIRKSREGSTKGNLGALRAALSIYYADMEGQYPTDDLSSLMVNGKYIAAIPTLHTPDYHADANTVVSPMGCAVNWDENAGGKWIFYNSPTCGCPMAPSPARCVWGEQWIGCGHTDTKGSSWTQY